MSEAMIAELEAAARVIMQPPNVVSNEQRHQAERTIMCFRRTPAPYAICRDIFEKSQCDLLLFEAADTLKRSIIVEWNGLADDDRLLLRQYLLQHCLTRDMPSFVRAKILQVVAIMIKRASIQDSGAERIKILEEMCQTVRLGDARQKFTACRIIYTIMQEFGTTIKSDDTGLTFEEHFKAMKLFELSDLKKIFIVIFESCRGLLSTFDPANDAEQVQLLLEYLNISVMVLQWGYVSPLLPKRLINALEINKIDQSPPLRLSVQWAPIMIEPSLVEHFFSIYWKVRDIDELQPKALACLVQLSTLNGPVIDGPSVRLKYVANYMQHFLQLLCSRPVGANEAFGFAIVFRKILLYTTDSCLQGLPEEMRHLILQEMCQVTCNFMELIATEDQQLLEDSSYLPALNTILEAWLLIMQARNCFSIERIQQYAVRLFNQYLQHHLSYAARHGGGVAEEIVIGLAKSKADETTADNVDNQLSEFERYEEQLIIIGLFGREKLSQTLPTLCQLLEERTLVLRDQLLRIYQSGKVDANDTAILETIYDDLLWVLMVSAHVLAIKTTGEEALVPLEVRKFSYEMTGRTDVGTTLKLLASPGQLLSEVAGAETSADYVVRLIAAVFRLCDIESKAIELNMMSVLSPELSKCIMTFLLMWSESYLLMNNTYGNLSDSLEMAFGAESDGGKWSAEFILNKICVIVRAFYAEPQVVNAALDVFDVLVQHRMKRQTIFALSSYKQVLELRHLEIPKATLLKGLIRTAACIDPTEYRQQYLHEILAPIRDSFEKLEWQQAINSSSDHSKSNVSIRLAYLLDEIRAICTGASKVVAPTITQIFHPIFMNLSEVLSLFHNFQSIVVAIFELLCVMVDRLKGSDIKINEICVRVVREYVKHNANRVSVERTAEEDNLDDLLLLLRMATNFLNVALFDTQENESDGDEVCLEILQYIMPMITLDMLKYPNFCMSFYQTLKIFVKKPLIHVHPDFMQHILQCTVQGLGSFGTDIQSVCLEIVNLLASQVYYDQNPESFLYMSLMPFVKRIFGMILAREIDHDNRAECGRATFTLLCVYRTRCDQILEMLLLEPLDTERREQLRKEFNELARPDNLYINRNSHLMFSTRFERFLANMISVT